LAPLSIIAPASSFGVVGGEIATITPTTIDPQRKKRKKDFDIR
jgi:hypothetical protein